MTSYKKKLEAFKTDLKELLKKYKFGKHEMHDYNEADEYCGSDYYFVVDGKIWYGESIDEILDTCIIKQTKEVEEW